jgi:glutamate/tyrosine decarboxylase-like PLP-dependent enzyme
MAWDQNAALPVMSPVATRMHAITWNWLVQLFGLPRTSEAAFVIGATMANAAALAARRITSLAG